ncbi:hypothetical protein SERLA73DRAFT_68036 [Serpula lacrymans var. lacrymans S7.3]|uniref:Uncharacterized protein n=2 Tax=Serpula lacrymans var. lacrymans TaxID=341189 RepID=F8PG91_SERL3|nr:uncharacterized protein SERLADRAFT_431747 [Serpula lacrymans var. lacrymans S7.9]EGO04338.1 hypothetical protein SERLA73DRAFT_68036 [Serpula lacrymans var. lacrymans S7.3]EGO30253.1 hypothetical protein SERLADRAFT_431747 [Serpula lacrymans var. lacrymans S7.9]
MDTSSVGKSYKNPPGRLQVTNPLANIHIDFPTSLDFVAASIASSTKCSCSHPVKKTVKASTEQQDVEDQG